MVSRECVDGCTVPRCGPLRPSLVKLHLVDGPDGSFDVLDAHETFVQRQVVTDRVLLSPIRWFSWGAQVSLISRSTRRRGSLSLCPSRPSSHLTLKRPTERSRWKTICRYLPGGRVVTEVAESVLEPGVDLVERQLLLRRFDDGLSFTFKWKNQLQMWAGQRLREITWRMSDA